MKRKKTILIALNTALTFIVTIVSNVLSANIPSIPMLVIWCVGASILIVSIIVSIITTLAEKKSEEVSASQRIRPMAQQPGYAIPYQAPSSHTKTQTYRINQTIQRRTSIPISSVTSNNTRRKDLEEGQPTIESPMLICLALDVSYSMKQPIVDHTGKTITRWTSISNALEHFVHLGVSWVKDPETQKVLPLYHLMAYGFGFRELMHAIGRRKTLGGSVRDLLAHPVLPSLPSAAELSEHWRDYQDHILSQKEYTGDLFGSTPLYQALTIIRDRIWGECKRIKFTFPILLLIISDGLSDDGEDPLPLIEELHRMGVLTLCCYLASHNVLVPRQLYEQEDAHWPDGAKLMFRCASALHRNSYISHAMFNYLSDHGWQPHEGVHLFSQVNQAEGLDSFLEVLLRGTANERSG